MSRPEEDAAWRAIVENYGERAEIDDRAVDEPDPAASPDLAEPASAFTALDAGGAVPGTEEPDEILDRFVPPDPPPPPLPEPRRVAAWAGLFGAPALLLVAVVFGIELPSPISLGLLAWFGVGFCYLVWNMPKGPHDPWDNGARL